VARVVDNPYHLCIAHVPGGDSSFRHSPGGGEGYVGSVARDGVRRIYGWSIRGSLLTSFWLLPRLAR